MKSRTGFFTVLALVRHRHGDDGTADPGCRGPEGSVEGLHSGVGGQIDYVYGSSRAKGGKAIIAMPSTTRKGINKIVPALDLGSGAVTTRNHIHWFITEYGAVNLYGRSLQERAKLIISVAHPQFQEQLDEARKLFEEYFKTVFVN